MAGESVTHVATQLSPMSRLITLAALDLPEPPKYLDLTPDIAAAD
jgi:hypothetical protein